jgi:DNA-binding NarL/FixJ family response regulator
MDIEQGIGAARPRASRAWPSRLRVAPDPPVEPPPSAERVSVLVAAGSAALGAGLQGWLATADAGWRVEVVVTDRATLAASLHPGLGLVVATIPAGGEALIFAIRDAVPGVPVLALAERGDAAYEAAIVRAGATGAIGAGASCEEVVRAARELVAGRSVMSADALRLVAQGPPRVPHLTGRQREVLRLMADGRSTREIAQQLVIAQSTVKTHIARLAVRLDVADRGEMRRSAAALLALAGPPPAGPREEAPDARR